MTRKRENMRWAAVFPGAGIDMSGHERAFLAEHRDAMMPVLAEVSDLAGLNLVGMVEDESLGDLSGVQCQTSTFAFGLGVFRVFSSLYGEPHLVAGHSLGIYGAMVAAQVLSVRDGLTVLKAAHRHATAAFDAASNAKGGMVAVAGLSPDEVDGVVASLGRPSLERVITNSVTSSVVAGVIDDVGAFAVAADDAGAVRVVWIDREVAYHHSRLMVEAAEALSADLATVAFEMARPGVVSTINGDSLSDPGDLRAYVVANFSSPIDWQKAVAVMTSSGVNTLVECGPGTTLTRMGRFIDGDARYLNVRKAVRRGL